MSCIAEGSAVLWRPAGKRTAGSVYKIAAARYQYLFPGSYGSYGNGRFFLWNLFSNKCMDGSGYPVYSAPGILQCRLLRSCALCHCETVSGCSINVWGIRRFCLYVPLRQCYCGGLCKRAGNRRKYPGPAVPGWKQSDCCGWFALINDCQNVYRCLIQINNVLWIQAWFLSFTIYFVAEFVVYLFYPIWGNLYTGKFEGMWSL